MRARRARRQSPWVGGGALAVRDPGRKEHELRRLVARSIGAVAEVHAGLLERARAAVDGGADRFGCRVG